eukprot:1147297-Pelagomonas_calceolata.AAC.4
MVRAMLAGGCALSWKVRNGACVSDFGLSVRMDLSATHVSSLFQGTLTHMSPEVLLKGTCSKASD